MLFSLRRSVHATTLWLSTFSSQVCRIRRAFYGLKQVPWAWFEKFSSVVAHQGFTSSPHDTTFFVRRFFAGITLILLYVDDMIITEDDSAGIRSLHHFLSQHFEMKDLDTLSYFLGLEVTSSSDRYYLSQAKYAFDLLSKASITEIRLFPLPWNTIQSSHPWMVNLYPMLLAIVSWLVIWSKVVKIGILHRIVGGR